MSSILVDAGPLVALCDPTDAAHEICASAFETIRWDGAITTIPVLAEAFHLTRRSPASVRRLMNIAEDTLNFAELDAPLLKRSFELMRQYANARMDFADATLVAVAESRGLRTVFTLDRRDFSIYRIMRGHEFLSFEMIP